MGKEDQKILRDWRDNFGKPVRQLTVRNQSTKDNVGTLSIFAYTTPDPPEQPLNLSAMTDQTARSARAENNAPSFETRRTTTTTTTKLYSQNHIVYNIFHLPQLA